MVHSADTPVADTAMVRHGRFEGLALPAHGVRIFHESLTFAGDGSKRDTTRIGETCLCVTSQCHKTQHIVNHSADNRDALRYSQ